MNDWYFAFPDPIETVMAQQFFVWIVGSELQAAGPAK